jgi:hypothetical protein
MTNCLLLSRLAMASQQWVHYALCAIAQVSNVGQVGSRDSAPAPAPAPALAYLCCYVQQMQVKLLLMR